MVSCSGGWCTYDARLSSVVPATVTGEDKVHGLSNMDLGMKLHYLKGVYFFRREAVEGLTVEDLKKPMFEWLKLFYMTCGRIRRSESGRPVIKCNDGGVRIVEAQCEKSLDEWMAMEEHNLRDGLVYDQVLGPDLFFSPLVYVQFTWFKCGGMSAGLNWAHVLGDAFSAASFFNVWSYIMAAKTPPQSLRDPTRPKRRLHSGISPKPLSLKMIQPVGDRWGLPSHSKMGTHYFYVAVSQLKHLLSSAGSHLRPFHILSAIMWKALARIRGGSEESVVTVCRNSSGGDRENEIPTNAMEIGTVEAYFDVADAGVGDLGKLIAEKMVCENGLIEETVGEDDGKSDFMVYGGNLTFVNLEDLNLFGLEMKGHKPVRVNYSIAGVGDEGAFLVLPGQDGGGGRTVTAILPENQLAELRKELKNEWSIV